FKAIPEIYNIKRHPVVPDNIELLDYDIDDSVLTLIFNEDFIGPYKDNPDRHKIMVDGIIFTFMSLENVDSIKIKIRPGSKDSGNKQFLNYDFTMPVYINPEK
ncbi:MAG TPA: GerMN domain-containing protein, partial [Oscillospiraceae bacterium]|nr:GerMN domain-containing protein [Oscillospiraceae bacterium]